MIPDNVDWIKENAKCLDNIKYQQHETRSVCVARLWQRTGKKCTKNLWMSLTFLLW
jgi:hypothetical protein